MSAVEPLVLLALKTELWQSMAEVADGDGEVLLALKTELWQSGDARKTP